MNLKHEAHILKFFCSGKFSNQLKYNQIIRYPQMIRTKNKEIIPQTQTNWIKYSI